MKRYLISFFSILIPCASFLVANYTIVLLAGETTPYSEIARWQQEAPNRIYGPLFNNDHVSYKYNLFEQRKSQIVVAGSSRALEHQQNFYSQEITNMGRSINTLKEALRFFKYMEKQPQVHTVLLIADFWWFRSPLDAEFKIDDPIYSQGTERSLDMFFLPILYALQGKLNIRRVIHLSKEQHLGKSRIGIRSLQQDKGFRSDGARQGCDISPSLFKGQTKSKMIDEMNTRLGVGRFTYATKVQYSTIDRFFTTVNELKNTGKNVIVVFSPLSPVLYNETAKNSQLAYVPNTLKYMKRYPIHDYLDPAKLKVNNSDFQDFFHTGPHVEAKLLLALAKEDFRVQNIVNLSFLTAFSKTDYTPSKEKLKLPKQNLLKQSHQRLKH